MTTETESISKKPVHLGHNSQRIREMLGMKQDVLAEKTKWSQQNISKLEQTADIPDDILKKLADGLGVTPDFIKNFNEERAIYNIQNNFTYHNGSSNANMNWQPTINNNPIEKVVELFEKLLQSEREKVELLTNANKAIRDLSEHIRALKS